MDLKNDTPGRFAGLLSRSSRMVWDTVLYEDEDVVVIPTLGALVPDWVLVVPKAKVLNFSIWTAETGRDPVSLLNALHQQGVLDMPAIWFEHGASTKGSEVGCGVDHAHIHVLMKPACDLIAFKQLVRDHSGVPWSRADARSVYPQPVKDKHYYAFGDFDTAYVHVGSTLGSQFFRKVVARLVGQPEQWDYRVFQGVENVKQTIARYSADQAA